jgi:hypothetical protein
MVSMNMAAQESLFAANRKRATWTHHCEAKSPKAPSRLSFQVKDSEKFGLGGGAFTKASELSAADSSDVSKVAQLAKLYAMGTPSEKEFQRLKGLISQSLRNSQAPI